MDILAEQESSDGKDTCVSSMVEDKHQILIKSENIYHRNGIESSQKMMWDREMHHNQIIPSSGYLEHNEHTDHFGGTESARQIWAPWSSIREYESYGSFFC